MVFSEADTKASTNIGDFLDENLQSKPMVKKPKKTGVKLKLHFQNGINKIIEDCQTSKNQL